MKTYKLEFFYGDAIHACYLTKEETVRSLVNELYSGQSKDFPTIYDKFGNVEKEPNDVKVREIPSLPEGCKYGDI